MGTPAISDLVAEVKAASENITRRDGEMTRRLDGLEGSINELHRKFGRPGAGDNDNGDLFSRKAAHDYCVVRKNLTTPRLEGGVSLDYTPSSDEIDTAMLARQGLRTLLRVGDPNRLPELERKSLSAFSFGSNSFLLAPEMSSRVLTCITDPTDLAAVMGQATTSSGSIKFLVDNARVSVAGWACESACFANNPNPDLQDGLGTLEIKAESLRYVACASSDLVADASFNLEGWLLDKVARAFRAAISAAIIAGDGVGRPAGILHPNSGIPRCETAPATPAGTFSWQDLVMLKFELPMEWQAGGSFLMNQRTFALLQTMSDTSGRPLLTQSPQSLPTGFSFAGSPIAIATQMPDVAPGSIPVAFGNWRSAYLLVTRQGTNLVVDPFTAGWCYLYKVDCRVGGSVVCPNAARLLYIP